MKERTAANLITAGWAIIAIDATFWAVFLTVALTDDSKHLWSWPTWTAITVFLLVGGITLWGWTSKPKTPKTNHVRNDQRTRINGDVTIKAKKGGTAGWYIGRVDVRRPSSRDQDKRGENR